LKDKVIFSVTSNNSWTYTKKKVWNVKSWEMSLPKTKAEKQLKNHIMHFFNLTYCPDQHMTYSRRLPLLLFHLLCAKLCLFSFFLFFSLLKQLHNTNNWIPQQMSSLWFLKLIVKCLDHCAWYAMHAFSLLIHIPYFDQHMKNLT